jgi:glycosyltransferase involved in cell wall biosynthesis
VEDIGGVDGLGMSDPLPISVVMPVRNGMPWIDRQLQALCTQEVTCGWEVVVADNGSVDGTRGCVEGWSAREPRIRLIDASLHAGPGAARNMGVQSARGRVVVFCDADDVVRPGWLAALAAALSDADVAAGIFDFGALDGSPSAHPIPAATRQFGFLPFGLSANLGLRREAIESVDGFREELLAGEDIDLCWRLQLAGYRFVVTDDAVVEKRERAPGLPTFRAGWAYGRCGPRLFARFRAKGMRRDLRGATKTWIWLVVTLPGLVRPGRRQQWVRTLAVRSGRLAGSLRLRVFFP